MRMRRDDGLQAHLRDARVWIAALLLVLVAAVFGQVANHQFINLDDDQFIRENAVVRTGLNPPSFTWALSSSEFGWYPLTWISHEIDVQLWGLEPRGHLLTQLLLHALSTLLLFFTLDRMTGAAVRSGFVAALFAIHPMHVESVAWASERKDTLSTLFAIAALFVYAHEHWPRRRLTLAALLAASLMAKQMYVTLPLILMLLDVWPLRRGLRIAEKLPLFAISAAGVVIAIIGQRNMKTIATLDALPVSDRIANALSGTLSYLEKLAWPARLALPYPMTDVTTVRVAIAVAVLTLVSVIAWRLRERSSWLPVGWCWFLVTLLPVIGLVQIGPQAIADRYTYFAYTGLFIAIVWSAAEFLSPRIAVACGSIIVLAFAVFAWNQVRNWKDSATLFRHTIAVTGPNALAEYCLGQALQLSSPAEAIPHLQRSIEIAEHERSLNSAASLPGWYAQAWVGLGTARLKRASTLPSKERAALLDAAESDLRRALAIDPKSPHAANNLAFADAMRRQLDRRSVAADTLMQRAASLWQQRRFREAATTFHEAADAAPDSVEPLVYEGLALIQAGHPSEAVRPFVAAQKIDAVRANEVVTQTLRLAPNPDNLGQLIRSLTEMGVM
jgi:tetratricopeptide (TPR) repeat protein